MPATPFEVILDGTSLCEHALPNGEPPGEGWRAMIRRGVDHGVVRRREGDAASVEHGAVVDAWRNSRPIVVRGAVSLAEHQGAINASRDLFTRLRDGARFLEELEQRLWDDETFRYAGSTVAREDLREIERVFVNAVAEVDGHPQPQVVFADITARLSWVATDELDHSLRLRFSYGHEPLGDWLADSAGRPWAARLCETVFPESVAITACAPLMAWLHDLLGGPLDCGEHIVYSNAPEGGAVFHHDADPGQRGVLFTQLAGYTGWLALPKEDLAALVGEVFGGAPVDLDCEPLPRTTWERLNASPLLTNAIWRRGGMFVLAPGDAIVLGSHNADANTWHSVFALGRQASLAHSYGLFDSVAAVAR